MPILGLLGMYFDAVVVEVKKNLHLFRLALAILCYSREGMANIEREKLTYSSISKIYRRP